MKTFDGEEVKEGDTVFVIGSCGVHEAKVLEPVTNYELFGNIPVRNSFSTKEEADKVYKELSC